MDYSRFKSMKSAVAVGETVYAPPKAEQAVRAKQANYARAVANHVPVHFMGGPTFKQAQRVLIYKGIWAGLGLAMANQVYVIYKQAYDLK